ncbi:MAG TPA: hypothetical protein VND87_03935 [Stellaceae bacterium]|nr:hypothetical protein [Stellaceae bacterium]
MARAMMQPGEEPGTIPDDYLIDRDGVQPSPPVGLQIIRALRLLLIVVLALASLSLFWVIGTMIGLF